jgi:hypothetical protein
MPSSTAFIGEEEFMRPLQLTAVFIALAGIAAAAQATSTNVDPGYYRKYTCPQLLDAAKAASVHVITLSGNRKNAATNNLVSSDDIVIMPKSDARPVSGEFALARKQLLAIQDASIQSQCDIEFLSPGADNSSLK